MTRKFWIAFLLLTAYFSLLTAFAKEGPFPGETAPNFQLKSLSGETVELRSLYSKGPLWLSLFTTWCPDCNIETPDLVKASKNHPEIQFLAVSLLEEKKDVEKFRKRLDVPYPLLLDAKGQVTDLYQIRPIPLNLGIKQGGEIAFRRQTVSEEDIETLISTLSISEKPSTTEPSKSASPQGALNRLFTTLPVLASFIAGLLTFLSPCVLPLIPIYLSFVTGLELENLLKEGEKARKHLMISTLLFVSGFSLVFILLGATASSLGRTLLEFQKYIRFGGGAMMIILGLHIAGIFRLMPLYREMRFQLRGRPLGFASAFLMGLVFAVGWTPCVGPILSSILVLSAQQETIVKGMILLTGYSLGIGIPILLASAFLSGFQGFIKKIKPHFDTIEKFTGSLFVLLGLLLLTNKLTYISGLLSP